MKKREQQELKAEIDDGIELLKKKKYMASQKKRSLSKKEFTECGVELSIKQDRLYKGIRKNTLSIISGPAGTSKTFTSCYTALGLYADKKIDKIIITKPMQVSGSEIGYLPGTLEDKQEPFMSSYISNFYKIIGKQTTDFMISTGDISIEALAFMRGATYDSSVMLIDEAQNCSMKELMLWSTRLGDGGSKMIMMGDTSQFDVKKRDSGFPNFINMVDNMSDLLVFEFLNEDIVRNKFLIELTNRYDKYRSENDV